MAPIANKLRIGVGLFVREMVKLLKANVARQISSIISRFNRTIIDKKMMGGRPEKVLVGWVERSSPDGVQVYVALWKPNDIQITARGA